MGDERERARLAIDSDGRFRAMFERSGDAIVVFESVKNVIVDYNHAALEMLRCTRDELSAMHPSQLSPPTQPDGRASYEKSVEYIERAIREGSHRFEWIHRSPNRDDFPAEVLLTTLPIADDAWLIVAVMRDITDRKRADEALRQAQRLESVGMLAGGVAHDFNNLLTAVLGHLEMARTHLEERHPASPHLDTMEQAVLAAADLTRQLLAYGGRGQFLIEPIDLARLVRDMADLLRVSMSRQVALACELPHHGPVVDVDRSQMRQVVLNLVTNAAEAIGEADGAITLQVGRAHLDADAVRTGFPEQGIDPGDKVTLTVRDTGLGMAPDVQARIFDPFFSTKETGRGLGLAALRGILKGHRAGYRITSAVGTGTTFEVVLPESTAVLPAEPPAPPLRHGHGGVLLVDDDEAVRGGMRALLEHLGFSVIEAADGVEAVAAFSAHRHRIGWVLLDLTMPRMDGHKAFHHLTEIDPDVIVVVASGWAETEIIARFAAQRPAAILPKPYTRRQLQDVLSGLGLVGPAGHRR